MCGYGKNSSFRCSFALSYALCSLPPSPPLLVVVFLLPTLLCTSSLPSTLHWHLLYVPVLLPSLPLHCLPHDFPGPCLGFGTDQKRLFCRTHWMFCVLFSCKVQWSHLASLKNNVTPVSRSHSFSDPSPPKFAHHHLRSQDPCPPSRSEALGQSSDSRSELPDPTQKAWSRSDSEEVPPRVRSRKTDVCFFFLFVLFKGYLF